MKKSKILVTFFFTENTVFEHRLNTTDVAYSKSNEEGSPYILTPDL